MHHHKTYMYLNFQLNLVSRSAKSCTQIYLQNIENCINLQRAIRISKTHALWTCTTTQPTFTLILGSIGLLNIKLPRKEIIDKDGQTDGRTD